VALATTAITIVAKVTPTPIDKPTKDAFIKRRR
jgi:hypothetical protein